MSKLIIGHRGFVGSNLARQLPSALGAGRKEMNSLAGHDFTEVYCAAPQAKKWWANKNPELDKLEVSSLISSCKRLGNVDSFILFSTVDVYDPPALVDERTVPSVDCHPYGRNRIMLEQSIIDLYGDKARIIRLPALVGHGLKKNIIFDLLNSNNISSINPNSSFQWFNLDYLLNVIDRVKLIADGQLLNIATEPVSTSLILDRWFPYVKEQLNWDTTHFGYDVRTVYGPNDQSYLYSATDVMNMHLQPFLGSIATKS